MKFFFTIVGAAVTIGLFLFLYKLQLGAISFLLLAIFFFMLSYRLFNYGKKRKDKKE
ncbi:hypothetical protein [Bacillus sp. B15-48]|uniref:hypothetical protein n=1 Tax=Bacillus sp. B15-48 TaxID=1548601 RepID=UPI00193FAF1D|nr:hypothetical protein [Bacillus sp. B15-48]MBM4761563.1 hypothetical protein [Bacillus sp. B15-48]